MHLESLPLDGDRRALQSTDVLALIHAERRRWRCPCPPVHLLEALPCIDGHPERDTGVRLLAIIEQTMVPMFPNLCPGPRLGVQQMQDHQTLEGDMA